MGPEPRDKGFPFLRQRPLAVLGHHLTCSHRAKQSRLQITHQSTQLFRCMSRNLLDKQAHQTQEAKLLGTPDLTAMVAFSHSNYGNTSVTLSCFWLSVETPELEPAVQHPFSWRPEFPFQPPIHFLWLASSIVPCLPHHRLQFPFISHGLLKTQNTSQPWSSSSSPEENPKGLLRP